MFSQTDLYRTRASFKVVVSVLPNAAAGNSASVNFSEAFASLKNECGELFHVGAVTWRHIGASTSMGQRQVTVNKKHSNTT